MALPAGQPPEVAQAFADIAEARRRIIPVVGAGLAGAAGAPSPTALVDALRTATDHPTAGADLFDVADELEQRHGTAWVQRIVAETTARHAVVATRTLRSLVRLPSRIVATTNYDDAVAVAVEDVGLRPRIFHGRTLNEGLRIPDDDDVHILHLHGHHTEPASMVLTRRSYEQAASDSALEYALHRLAAEHVVVFLGQSLTAREHHVRRDLLWANRTFRDSGPHYLFLPEAELPRPDLDEIPAADAATVVTPYRNDDGTFEVVSLAAQHIGLGLPATGTILPTDAGARRTRTYLPVPIAPADELAEPSQRAAWEMVGTAFDRHVDLDTVLARPRAVLFGAPGSGKSQALLHAGHTTRDRHVIYRSLGDIPTPHPSASAIDTFLLWVRRGSAFHDGTPLPTRPALSDQVFLFLLDGLDEVGRGHRHRVLEIITELAGRFPHHLFLLASRPYHGADDDILSGFDTFELVPDRTWFRAYLDHVGVTDQQVERVLPVDAPLQDLVRLPIFAEAVADAARAGHALPPSPLQAIRHVASSGLRRDTHLLSDPDRVDRWLDVLAVLGEARHSTGLPADIALDQDIAAPFDVAPTVDLLDSLVERALVVSAQATVTFPANVVQEARAAHGLLQSPNGLQLLHELALVELDDGTRGIHPAWRHTVELLGHDAPPAWRRAIAVYDPRRAARATPDDAAPDERAAAMHTLLSWYDERKVWWLRAGDHGQLRDDLDVVATLARDSDLRREAVEWAWDRLGSPERALRGNAMLLLSRLDETEKVEAALPAALTDSDSVVRRIAAEAHGHLRLAGYHMLLRGALDARPDDLEERQLLAEYIRTAPAPDIRELLVARWPSEMSSWAAGQALAHRFSRQEQLEALNDADAFAAGWLGHLLGQKDSSWTPVEVELLTRLLYRETGRARRYSFDARPILRQHLSAALPIIWAADETDAKVLLYQSPSDRLAELVDHDLPADLHNEIVDLLERRRLAPPSEPNDDIDVTEHEAPHRRQRTLAEAAVLGWDAVTDVPLDLLDHELRELADEGPLRVVVEAAWEAAGRGRDSRAADLRRVDSATVRARTETFSLLHLAAHFRLPLDRATWLHLVRVGWPEPSLAPWLRDSVDPDWYPTIEEEVPTISDPASRLLVDVLPMATTPDSVAIAVATRLRRLDDSTPYRHYVAGLAAAHRTGVIQHLHAADPVEATTHALVRLGNCDAEHQLLEAERQADLPRNPTHFSEGHWLNHVRCTQSIPLITERIVEAESGQADHAYRSILHAALHRAAGVDGLGIYQDLIRERPYPDAPFLWFRQAELRDQLLTRAVEPVTTNSQARRLTAALFASG